MEELKKAVEESLSWSDAEYKEKMPGFISQIRGRVGEILDAVPDLPQRLIKRMEESDTAKMANEAPEASDAFTELLWEVVSVLAEKKPDLKKVVEEAGD
ncbi:MAG: hypothetical protein ACTSWF_11500, partial [Candidatus Freyarchaeota archaeon]